MIRALLGLALGILSRAWLFTLRLTVVVDPALAGDASRDPPWVLAFLHGKQWPLLAWPRRRPTAVIVSLSKDGAMQSRALGFLGFSVVRGSSSRGGARALAGLIRKLKKSGHDAAFAVDGPRGPYGRAKPGVIAAARAARGVIVPMGSAIASGTVLATWDRFELAWPFSRVCVVLGPPLHIPSTPSGKAGKVGDEEEDDALLLRRLEGEIVAASQRAEAFLAGPPGVVVPFSRFMGSNTPLRRSAEPVLHPALNAEDGGSVQRPGA